MQLRLDWSHDDFRSTDEPVLALATTSSNCPSSGGGNGDDITNPHSIVVGPDGNLWFTDNQGGPI